MLILVNVTIIDDYYYWQLELLNTATKVKKNMVWLITEELVCVIIMRSLLFMVEFTQYKPQESFKREGYCKNGNRKWMVVVSEVYEHKEDK